MHLVQRDLSHFSLAGFNVRAQQHGGLFAAFVLDGHQDLGVLFIRGVNPRLLGEVQPADQANAVRHVAMHTGHFGIARRCHQRAVKSFVPAGDLYHVAAAPVGADQPDRHQLIEQCLPDFHYAFAEAVSGGGFEHHAQVVELFKLVEVKRQHTPAAAKQNLDKALLLQAEQRNLLAAKVSRQLRARPDGAGAAREIAGFVTGPWAQVIAQARLGDPAASADPGGYTGLLSDLLWSAQPQLASGNRARLTRVAPLLLEKIREGLASIDYPAAESRRFIDLLVVMQQKALVPAGAQPAPMTREELDSWFAPASADGGSPWLAPGEAQESGFMETHQAADRQPLYQPTEGAAGVTPGADWLDAVPTLGAEGLQPGAWVEMLMEGQWSRLQLTWASPHGTLFMFTDAVGRSHSMTRRLLDQLVAAQGLHLISDQAVVDGALDAVARVAVRNSPDLRQ